jgi:hypothetical protein
MTKLSVKVEGAEEFVKDYKDFIARMHAQAKIGVVGFADLQYDVSQNAVHFAEHAAGAPEHMYDVNYWSGDTIITIDAEDWMKLDTVKGVEDAVAQLRYWLHQGYGPKDVELGYQIGFSRLSDRLEEIRLEKLLDEA